MTKNTQGVKCFCGFNHPGDKVSTREGIIEKYFFSAKCELGRGDDPPGFYGTFCIEPLTTKVQQ